MPEFEKVMPPDIGLQEGDMTQVTPGIQELAENIGGDGMDFLENAALYLARHYQLPQNKPDRMKRSAHEILLPGKKIPPELQEGLDEEKLPIGTCTEHGKALRALCLAKKIPCIFVDTVNERWIREKSLPKDKHSPPPYSFTGESGTTERHRVFATGLDHTKLWTEDGRELSFHSKKDWHIFVNHEFPERMKALKRLPKHF